MPMMIAFDKLTYTPGTLVSGHVVIIRKRPEKVKGLTMRFVGRSSKLVSETESPVKNYKKEVYFDEKMDIFGHDGRDTILKVGETIFPFTFSLPPGLPSSFVWSRGNILYFVEAKLTRSSWKEDKRVSCRLSVEGIHDLNLDPVAPLPNEIKRHKYIQHLLSKSGPLGFTFKVNRTGFVRGHTIPFYIEVKNLSKIDAKKVKISLVQEINQDGKVWTGIVEEVKGPSVPSGEIQSWETRMKVPSEIPPTNLGNLLNYPVVLSVNYFLHIELSLKSVTVSTPRISVDTLNAKIPVTIGTISLLRSRDRLRLQQLQLLQLQGLQSLQPSPHCSQHSQVTGTPGQPQGHEEDCPLSQLSQNQGQGQFSEFSPGTLGQGQITQGQSANQNFLNCQNENHNHLSHLQSQRPLVPNFNCNLNLNPHLNLHFNCLANVGRLGWIRPNNGPNLRDLLNNRRVRNPRRNFQFRESPPPSYDEVVASEDRTDTILVTQDRNRKSTTEATCSTSPQGSGHRSSSEEEEEVVPVTRIVVGAEEIPNRDSPSPENIEDKGDVPSTSKCSKNSKSTSDLYLSNSNNNSNGHTSPTLDSNSSNKLCLEISDDSSSLSSF